MKLEEFAKLVAEMRVHQIAYFQARSPLSLAQAKRLEKKVDDAIRQILDGGPKQGSLL